MAIDKGKILSLAWMMPPLVFPRSLQVSRTIKTLNEFGWNSTVVTVNPEAEPFASKDTALASLYSGSYQEIIIEPREEIQRSPVWLRAWRKLFRIHEVVNGNWVRRAYKVLQQEIADKKYDVLITFAQPWINHVVGLKVKRKNPSLPWVVHFSDPWVDSPYVHFANNAEERKARRQERDIIENADAVIFVNKYTADFVMKKYPAEWNSKVYIVPHGFDNELLALVKEYGEQDNFMRVVHTGNFYGHRNPEILLRAIAELVKDPDIYSSLRVEFVGYVDDKYLEMVKELELVDIVKFLGKAEYVDSLSVANRADLLLLMDAPADQNIFLPSKIVDYLMLKKPILGITPEKGASADVLNELGYKIVSPVDIIKIKEALNAAYQNWRNKREEIFGSKKCDVVEKFNILHSTRNFENAIDNVIKKIGR